jgi:hypothetical protein
MRRLGLIVLGVAILVPTPGCQSSAQTGTLVGAGVGAGAGALIDRRNPWRGALIGGAIGGVVGYAIGNEIDKQKRETAYAAARENRVVVREVSDTQTGEQYRVRSAPIPAPSGGTPTQVTTTVSKWDPATGQWVVQSESTQVVN